MNKIIKGAYYSISECGTEDGITHYADIVDADTGEVVDTAHAKSPEEARQAADLIVRNGGGFIGVFWFMECGTCGGYGSLRIYHEYEGKLLDYHVRCQDCDGAGGWWTHSAKENEHE